MNASPRPPVPTWSSAAVARALAAAVAALALFVAATVGTALHRSRTQHRERAAVATQNLSSALESYLGGVLDKIDLTLQAAADEWQLRGTPGPIDGPAFDAFLARQRGRVPELDAIRAFDARGELRHGGAPGARANVSDRAYFARLRDDPGAGLVLSPPVVGRLTGRPELIVARPLRGADGAFAGVVTATIPIDALARALAVYDVGPRGVISLRDEDLGLVLRRPSQGPPVALGDRTVSAELRALVREGRVQGTYAGVPVDGIERTFTFRRLPEHPLYVLVGVALDDFLAPWRREAAVAIGGGAAFVLLAALAAAFGHRSWRRREEAVLALARQETTFRLLAENVSDVIWMTDARGRLTYVSPAVERLLGYAPEEVLALPDERLHPPAYLKRSATVVARLREAPPHAQPFAGTIFEQELVRRDGTVVHAEAHFSVLWGEDGRPAGAIGVSRDVTERRALIARMQAAERMASLGTLAAGVAHEVNNPLTCVLGNVAFALEQLHEARAEPAARPLGETLEDARLALEDARSGALRVRDIVRDLETFSRPDRDTWSAVEVIPVVESCLKMAATATAKRARVVRRLGAVPPVRATEARLAQVILNLLVNAAQAIPAERAGDAEISIATGVAADGRVEIAVADTGPGIAPELLPRIFDPFFTTKAVGEGTGLGLSICHGIVKGLGGEIRVETAAGTGSRFSVLLPPAGADARGRPPTAA